MRQERAGPRRAKATTGIRRRRLSRAQRANDVSGESGARRRPAQFCSRIASGRLKLIVRVVE